MPRKRQEAHYETMLHTIKNAARQLMAEHGTAGLSIRGIAKNLKLSPPAIYTYFATLDDLITALIADSFHALADRLETERDNIPAEKPTEQLVAVLLAYRAWAVEHPSDFSLIYGSPIPGYEAPADVTVPAVIRSFVVIVGLIERLLAEGQAKPLPPFDQVPAEARHWIRAMIEHDSYPVSELALYLGISGWGQLHGIIMLELHHHLPPVMGDFALYYRIQMKYMLQTFGVRL